MVEPVTCPQVDGLTVQHMFPGNMNDAEIETHAQSQFCWCGVSLADVRFRVNSDKPYFVQYLHYHGCDMVLKED